MASAHPRRSGAQVLIDQLRIHGTDTIFGVPGESYLAALDALYAQRNSIRYVICRQEGGAAFMACADGAMTGYAFPDMLADVVRLGILVAFPAIALWLPSLMSR